MRSFEQTRIFEVLNKLMRLTENNSLSQTFMSNRIPVSIKEKVSV